MKDKTILIEQMKLRLKDYNDDFNWHPESYKFIKPKKNNKKSVKEIKTKALEEYFYSNPDNIIQMLDQFQASELGAEIISKFLIMKHLPKIQMLFEEINKLSFNKETSSEYAMICIELLLFTKMFVIDPRDLKTYDEKYRLVFNKIELFKEQYNLLEVNLNKVKK